MKKLFLLFFIGLAISSFAQKDSLQLGDAYTEDQLYIIISHNQLLNQPSSISRSGYLFGLSSGYIKDILLTRQGNLSVGLGFGYNFDTFNHGFTITEENNQVVFSYENTQSSNKFLAHNLEFPFQFRWRTSDAITYKFWRVYMGIKTTYNLSNKFKYNDGAETFLYKNVSQYQKWQFGATLSVGYDVFTIHAYYGLNPVLKNISPGTKDISSRIMKIGLVFYVL